MHNAFTITVPPEIIGQVQFVHELINRPNPSETALHYTEMLEHALAEKLLELVRKQIVSTL